MSKSIDLRDIDASYVYRGRSLHALRNVSLSVRPGEFVSVVGPSGCGKSTLLSLAEGLRSPDRGTVSIGGRPVDGPQPECSVVFQQYSLFPWMTVSGNIEFALKQKRRVRGRSNRRREAALHLAAVGLDSVGHRFPKELSGGQQQRAAIARALAENGEVLLMDEPFGAVDARNRAQLQDLLLRLWEGPEGTPRDRRKTVLFVTHDLDEALYLSDRIVLMAGSPGRIAEEFAVRLPRPRSRRELLRSNDYQLLRARISEALCEREERS